jgi:hypothetical protein
MFKDRVFDLDLIEGERGRICIHTSYGELSARADSFCDMCKFIRRELWYYHTIGQFLYPPISRESSPKAQYTPITWKDGLVTIPLLGYQC